jgi:hypothetical protein
MSRLHITPRRPPPPAFAQSYPGGQFRIRLPVVAGGS